MTGIGYMIMLSLPGRGVEVKRTPSQCQVMAQFQILALITPIIFVLVLLMKLQDVRKN